MFNLLRNLLTRDTKRNSFNDFVYVVMSVYDIEVHQDCYGAKFFEITPYFFNNKKFKSICCKNGVDLRIRNTGYDRWAYWVRDTDNQFLQDLYSVWQNPNRLVDIEARYAQERAAIQSKRPNISSK